MNVATQPATLATPGKYGESFEHRGRSYQIYKREQTQTAPYQFCITRDGKRVRMSLNTNLSGTAVARAKKIVDRVVAGKWGELDDLKEHNPSSGTLERLFELYRELAPVSEISKRNNVGSMKWLLEVATGAPVNPAQFSLGSIRADLVSKFQDAMVLKYQNKAGKSEPDKREARERALRSSISVIRQARSLFARKTDMAARYKSRGLILPRAVDDFMAARYDGKSQKQHYNAPSDWVVQKAFEEVETWRDKDQDIFIAFWLAVGAGLRRGEIRQMRWEYFIERQGKTWICGGIGKDGERIEVPIQEKAVAALSGLRRSDGPCLSAPGLQWARRLNLWMTQLGWNTEKKMHELRSYVGSLIYQRDPTAAMRFLRHKTIRQTEQFYVRYGKEVLPPEVL